ncbi:MAG: DUF4388 domain-containing protein [Acidobacteria bacterium]|nr:DUF4388 domain-containing protein [Acidobacteriota bacterium]MBV9186976.1 DUF4388 domain-containing protein [Acidobacteriota bacterium]
MSDSLSIQGTLAETTVPDLFRSLVRSGETGIVSLEAIGRSDAIYFHEGRIVFASSSDHDMGLGEILLRSGELTLQQYNHAMDRLVVQRRIGALLCELGYLDPDGLMRALERQANAIVLNAIRYRTGSYTVEFSDEFPPEIVSLPLNTERLILDGVQAIEYWSLISRGVARVDRILQQVPGADMRTYAIELTDDESHVLNLLSDPGTIEEICARSYLSNFITCRTVWALMSVNLIAEAAESTVNEQRAAEETEYELEAFVERYNRIFESIFRIVFQRIGDHIYDFMDRVVVRMSPQTLPHLAGMNLVNEARIDFDQLLNNVIASGTSDYPAAMRNVLKELLAGWLSEIRTEFGPEMEAEVRAMAPRGM